MSRYTLREWEYLAVDDNRQECISRRAADKLVAAAKVTQLGGADGENILVNGHRRLRAQQVVGILATQDDVLEILPKIDGLDDGQTRHRLVHILARVFDLDIATGAMADLSYQRHDLLEIVVRLFCDRLFQAMRQGLPRRYIGHETDLPVLKGRLDIQRQFTVLAMSPQILACRHDELSANIPLNQILKAAVTCLRRFARAPENQQRLAELSMAYADVAVVSPSLLPWHQVILDRTNAGWATLLKLAKLFIRGRFQTTSFGDGTGFSLLFEMNTLFEEYVGRTLRHVLCRSGFDVRLQGPQSHALIGADFSRRFATKPDIVIGRGQEGQSLMIIDTKWKRLKGRIDDAKRGVGQGDVYQMMAYAQVYGCKRLMLLYPHHDEIGTDEGLLESHRINGTTDSRVSIATVSLSDISSIERRLEGLVLQGLPERTESNIGAA